jgi:exodeoxyribonuclease V alpha subunit
VDIRAALLLYEYIQEMRELGDTLFLDVVESYTQNRQRAYYEYGLNPKAMEMGVSILYTNADLLIYDKIQVMKRDLSIAKGICDRLSSLRNEAPKERAFQIPCKPVGVLSTIQEAFVRHVVTNQLTLLQGPPGTGKTECLVALMARFTTPLVVTFVGQMVDALQKRFGCRVETAHTIHSIIFNQGDWLDPFDLIIIDEFSNVDERLFSRLLAAVPRACRLVCAGDLAQIFPIKPGCPFFDLSDVFPQHSYELIENKRVDPDSAALAQASILLRDNRIAELPFSKDGALRFIDRDGLLGIEETILGFGKEVMDFQVVTLRNIDRRFLNDHIQKILIKNHILKPPKNAIELYGGKEKLQLYPGQKIQFLKNTPAHQSYSPVRNGELAKVSKVKRIGPSIEIVCTNGKRVLIGPSHVSKKHVIPGYATTCNKAQGSEWKYILFYIYENPNRFFTREYPYVAVSRAKKRCVIIGKQQEFAFLCAKKARPRASILHYLLTEEDYTCPFSRICDSSSVRMQNYDMYTILPSNVPAVPQMTIK